jgi:protein involved in polysaccharide export with SLBB domain
MNILFLRSLFIFTLLILGQSSFAQSTDDVLLKQLFIENQSTIDNLSKNKNTNKIDQDLISKNQNVANTGDSLQINLSQVIDKSEVNEQSMLIRYFHALIGKDLNIYGLKEFNKPQDAGLLFFNTIGKNYQLAPGDTIQVSITGLNPSDGIYQVMNDGTITLENVYPINVNNLKLNQVSKLVLDKLLLDDASAEVFVRLNNARLVTVQISGNVKYPRTIAVPAYTPLSRVIAYTGGISDSGSLRNISLSQIGETTQTVDFYNFLQNASPHLDPLIKNGARIYVPFKGPTIAITGLVNKPGIYELPTNTSEISIKNLLGMTGTRFLAPGAKLTISYFNSNGQITSRLVDRNESIKEGEALQIGFIETRDLNISKVSGAVLKDFEIITNTPLSIAEVLKDGAVFSLDAYTPFALIIGKEIQAINLNEALGDDSITLPVGSDLQLFTKEEYLELVAMDPNQSSNPIASKLANSNVAEIYLDGVRIAYIPISKDKEFHENIKDFYISSPKTVSDLALLKRNMNVDAFDLELAMRGNQVKRLVKGDRVFIFEDKFFNQLIRDQEKRIFYDNANTKQPDDINSKDTDVEVFKLQQELNNNKFEYMQNVEFSKKILRNANIIKISLDGELFTMLPFVEGISSSNVLNKLKNKLPLLQNEFVVVQNTDKNKSVKIKSINSGFKINENENINFISQDTYRKIINNYNAKEESALMNDIKQSDALKIYYDEKLAFLLSPNIAFSEQNILDKIINSDNFYRLYIGLSTKQNNNNLWTLRSYDAATLFSSSQKIIPNESNIAYMFSEQYIRDNFVNSLNRKELLTDNFKKTIDYKNINNNSFLESKEDVIEIDGLNQLEITANQNIDDELKQSNNKFFDYVLKSMDSKLRFISGAVIFPGTYPLADRVRLKDLIDVAGVVDTKASSDIIITKAIKENNILVKSAPIIIERNSLMTNEVILTGEFFVDVPKAINQAINGFASLTGEFMVPGDYAFSRSEPLSSIMQRAGGLTETAYPLGAVLERKSIQAQQKKSNEILASQLEASVLTLAQSDIDGVGEQIKAVLGFSQQLRNQPTSGRMTINIMNNNENLYLQDGDKLTVPKRPSHVSIIGAVQRTTVANYNKNKTYKDYIYSAGGLTKMADIRKAYLLLPNGESRLIENNIVIPVGSVIVVPPKIDKLSVLGLTDIISRVLGNIATSILAINNVN